MMRTLAAAAFVLAPAFEAGAVDYTDPTTVVTLDGLWLFEDGDSPSFARPTLDDFHWKERRLPTSGMALADRWQGLGWYRLHLTVSGAAASADLALSVGLVREAVEIYVNGSLVGMRGRFAPPRGGARSLPMVAQIPSGLMRVGDNVIALRIYDPTWTSGIAAGPLLLGPPAAVLDRVEPIVRQALGVRIVLATLALVSGLVPFALHRRRRGQRDLWWLSGAGLSVAVAHLADTGWLAALPADLASRSTLLTALTGTLCLGSFFGSRFDDFDSKVLRWGRIGMFAIIALLMLLWEKLIHFAAEPLLMVSSLAVTFYAGNLTAQAVRRGEPGALTIFLAISFSALVVVYDGMTTASEVLPPMTLMASVFVLLITAVATLRQSLFDVAPARPEERAAFRLLDGAAMPFLEPADFAATVIHEMARDLEVRRCSLIVPRHDGKLVIAASVGLPRHATRNEVDMDNSIAGWVYRHGEPLTPATLPEALRRDRPASYATDAFLSYPLRHDGKMLGVLSVSDRNDGGAFSDHDQAIAAELATRLSLLLARMPSVLPKHQAAGPSVEHGA